MTISVKNANASVYGSAGEPVGYGTATSDYVGVGDGSQLHFQNVMTPSDSQMQLQQVIISVPQSEPVVEALFSNGVLDPGSFGKYLQYTCSLLVFHS